ncbi:MAG: ATP synthase subunit I [Capsulimonas sp.]|uniref:ATP synthase subunit I n=1 Tax=Capsulimonas sp. TaxID=2494211 RepID=UPI0032658083
MNEAITLAASCLAGGVLGAIFFGGLWWTVRKGVASEQPALWFLGSLIVRMGVTLAGFYIVSGGHWERLLICLVGFVTARIFVSRLTRHYPNRLAREVTHAP